MDMRLLEVAHKQNYLKIGSRILSMSHSIPSQMHGIGKELVLRITKS